MVIKSSLIFQFVNLFKAHAIQSNVIGRIWLVERERL